MSRTGLIRRFFGDGDYDFRLALGQVRELQEITDCGLIQTLERCGNLRMADVAQVLRLGLIGAGLDKEAAFRLVERQVVDGYFMQAAALATDVVEAAARGAPDEPMGEAAGEGVAPLSPVEKSASPISTAPASRRGSGRATSMPGRSGNSAP